MNVANLKLFALGIFLCVGGLWVATGRAIAADPPGQLQPIPEQSPSIAQPEGTPFHEESPAYPESDEYDEYEDFYGMPVCSPPGRFWLRADYLMWWTSGMKLPPLVSTAPLGTPGGTILYGNSTVNNDGRSGYRTTLGMWLDACHVWDLEFDYLSLGGQSRSFSQTSSGDPTLMRPFFNVETGLQDGELVALTGQVSGTISVNVKDYFQSAGVSLSYNLCSGDCCDACEDPCDDYCGPPLLNCCRVDLLVGYRYYNLSDSVVIQENLTYEGGVPFVSNVRDSFRARNDFHGSEIGLRSQNYRGRWSLEILTKIAMGNSHEVVTIDGYTKNTPGLEYPHEGVFAVRSNETVDANGTVTPGVFSHDTLAVIPQLGLELGYQVNCNLRAYVGYNILYWGCVRRAADQIDLYVDPRNIPPTEDPALPFPRYENRTSCFWAQGVNVGAEYRF